MTSIKSRLAALSPEQLRALTQRLEQAKKTSAPDPARRRAAREGVFPLSDKQWSMWFLHRMAPEVAAYHVALALRVRGSVDPSLLERCLQQLGERHPILRTTYETDGDQTVQRVHARLPLRLRVRDAAGLTEEQLDQQLHESTVERFDLEAGPVWRGDLYTRTADEHVVLLVMHHIATDLWSLGILVEELQQLYRAELRGQPASLPPLPFDYVDYVLRRREELTGEPLERLWRYWQAELRDLPGPLDLPTDRPRPPRWSFRGATLPLRLGPELTAGLKSLARVEGKTLYAVLLAGFLTLLHRHTGQDDFLCGAPFWGRTQPDLQRVVGYFVNFVALRADLSGDPPFTELVDRMYRRVLGAIEHQELPFPTLCERLGIEQDPSRPRLLEVEFSFDQFGSMPGLEAVRDDVQMELKPFLQQQEGQFAINLMLVEVAGEIAGALRYSTDLFEQETMERFAAQLRLLYTSVLRGPRRRLSALPLLTETERRMLLSDWNRTEVDAAPDARAHELFEAQVDHAPDAVAVADGGGRLTYRELDARANQLAHRLRRLGVGPEVRVGLWLDRSADLVVGMLATLKAGGCYVPFDVASPPERARFLLADSGVRVLLGKGPRLEPPPAGIVVIDLGDEDLTKESATRPEHLALPTHAAYAIYTSGSTGRPKGVVVEHRQLVGLVRWHITAYGLTSADRTSVVASPSFDASGWEIWPSLASGAALFIPDNDTRIEPRRLLGWLAGGGITVAFLPTPLCEAVLMEPGAAELRLRWLLTGGDRLTRRPAADARFTLVNHYGPTEATVVATAGPVEAAEESPSPREPSIGGPIAGTRVYILDASLTPQPVGVTGELYVGGAGVARGYLGRPALTAERFVPDPFSPAVGARMYKTGDRARWLPGGRIQFEGRSDFQIKLRGHRIELGEIEVALLDDATVQQAVVIFKPEPARLVAYLVPRSGRTVVVERLREIVARRVPDYMVPSSFVVVDALPLTPSGKIDRKALPAPAGTELGRGFLAPRPGTEEVLAQLFAEVLGVERVGRSDDFFALGGHSLLATRLVSRVRGQLGVELPLRALFEAPTVAVAAARIDAVRAAPERPSPPLSRASRDRKPPLSFAQQRLWFLDQLDGGSSQYNLPLVLRLVGAVDVAALAFGLGEVVRRHEALRTTFALHDGEPVQQINPAGAFSLATGDVSDLPEDEREAAAFRQVGLEVLRPFDLSRDLMLRALLVKLRSDEHVLLVNMHHVASDGWSVGVILHEISSLYAARVAGEAPALPEPAVQYADFAVWQREWLRGDVLETQLAYWRRQLDGAAPLDLLTDKPRPAAPSHRGAARSLALPPELWRRLGGLCLEHGVTPFMVLLAAWQVLLHRITGQEDICVGTPIAGRRQAEVESLVGFFVNVLVMRARMKGRQRFVDVLAQVKEAALGAYAHQDLPFEKLVEELKPERDLGRSPLFQVMFALQHAPNLELEAPSLRMHVEELPPQMAKFELSLVVEERREGWRSTLEYSTDLYEDATIVRLLEHYRRLLESIASRPDLSIGELAIMEEAERRELLSARNAPREASAPAVCVHALVEGQVDHAPEALAVIDGESQLAYRELEARANRLAHRLRRHGVGPEVRVGLWLERSVDLVVAALATLKAGGAYVPIDPGTPAERVRFLLEDSGAAVLLGKGRGLAPSSGPRDAAGAPSALNPMPDGIVALEVDAEDLTEESQARPEQTVTPSNAAYVIYTSGSTGKPKGVVVEHRQLVNLVRWHVAAYGLAGADRTSLVASPAFDASVWEIWPSLAVGAALMVPDEDTRLDPARLRRWLAGRGLTVSFLPTPLCEALLAEPDVAELPLRWMLTGGDRLTRRPAADARFSLVNHYGPTETAVVATAGAVGAEGREPSIGTPITGARVYVLGPELEVQPVGVLGELYVGGAGVARGYEARPALTAERFLPDPFSSQPGARMYRTGDRARWLPSGELEFLGRVDFQVKLRGHRIELGEIEAALRSDAAVKEAVVVMRSDPARLVAYLVPSRGQAVGLEELRERLARQLPPGMVPSTFVVLDALPLAQSGKVDRQALPAPDEPDIAGAYIAPRPGTEELLARIFADVLGLPRVGRGDDFFALGGHSLLVTRVVSLVRARLDVELPLRAVFEARTPEQLAPHVEARASRASEETLPPIARASRDRPPPLSFAQQRLWFLDQLEPGNAAYNIPIALLLEGTLDVSALERSLGEVVRRHEALRTTFALVAGEGVQHIRPPGGFAVRKVDVSELPETARAAAARQELDTEVQRPFDLAHDLMLRALLVRLADEKHVLAITMHHVASDGWSLGVLLRELTVLYAAYRDGQASPLPALPVQYADFALWQRAWLRGRLLDEQLRYWRTQLAGAAPLMLPTDRPRPRVASHRGAALPVALPPALWQRIQRVCPEHGVTPFMLLLAVWQVLLHRITGQEDICVGTPIAGRRHADLEGLVGFFVNTLVLRVRIQRRERFREVLAQLKEVALSAYAHQDVPFEKVVEELKPERDLGRSPLFQVMFALQHAPMPELEIPGLRLRLEELQHTTAKFDLSLLLVEGPGSLHGTLEYNTDLFDPATASRLLGRWVRLLDALASQPDLTVGGLDLLEPAERHQLLVAWNDTAPAPVVAGGLHQAFERQVDIAPEAPALVVGTRRLGYRELEVRANQLAWRLRDLGVGPEVRVAVCLERSEQLVIALLGILKAGGAYVPLDPGYPRERLALMAADARCPVLVTQRSLAGVVDLGAAHVVLLDPGDAQLESQPRSRPQPVTRSEHLAYVLYTSGSTGRPKGVAIEHRSALALLDWAVAHFGRERLRGVLAATSVSFDLSVFELFAPLACGGCIYLADNALALVSLPARDEVTLLNTVPSAMAELLRLGAVPGGATTIVLAGEALPSQLAEALYALGSVQEVYNAYGPTEDTTYSTWALVPRSPAPPPIGRPLPGTRAYVLDEGMALQPMGVAGELYLAGMGLSRGYLGQPAMTAERFVPDPFGTTPGARMYRTGDLARWRTDGQLELLGRIDFQVKVRGFRIELGEVEETLRRHDAVREVVVVARGEGADQRLVAYVSARPGQQIAAPELIQRARQQLPHFMVPSSVVVMDSLPLTQNGKVDRKALPAVESAARPEGTAIVAPRDRIEVELVALFEELLGVRPIGVVDDFFALGGHSLLTVHLVAELQRRLGRKLDLAQLFGGATVESLAAMVRDARTPASSTPLVSLQRRGERPPLYCVHPIGGSALSFRELARALGEDHPLHAFHARGLEGEAPPFDEIPAMARYYLGALGETVASRPLWLGGWSFGGLVACEMARQLEAEGVGVAGLILLDTWLPEMAGAMASAQADQAAAIVHLARELGLEADVDTTLEVLAARAVERGLLPPATALAALERARAVFEAHRRAFRTYRATLARACRVVLVRPEQCLDPEAAAVLERDPTAGWSTLAPGRVELLYVPGDHFRMMRAPHVEAVAAAVRHAMQRSEPYARADVARAEDAP